MVFSLRYVEDQTRVVSFISDPPWQFDKSDHDLHASDMQRSKVTLIWLRVVTVLPKALH